MNVIQGYIVYLKVTSSTNQLEYIYIFVNRYDGSFDRKSAA